MKNVNITTSSDVKVKQERDQLPERTEEFKTMRYALTQ